MKKLAMMSAIMVVIAAIFVACAQDVGTSDMGGTSNRSLSTTTTFDDAKIASVRHVLGETAVTTPDIMLALNPKLSDWGRGCVDDWMNALKESDKDTEALTDLYDRAIDIYGSAAITDKKIIIKMLDDIDNPDDKILVEQWLQSNTSVSKRGR